MEGGWRSAWSWLPSAATLSAAALSAWWLRRRRVPQLPALAAGVDAGTGLQPPDAFAELLDEATHRSDLDQRPLALIHLGIDDFRLVNQACGRPVGDLVLAALPARLHAALPQAIGCSRVGGDEYVVALWADEHQAQAAAQQLLAELRRVHPVDGRQLALDASLGIALYPQHGSGQRLLVHAAAAMRAVKQAGGGAHAAFDPAMAVDLRQQSELLRDLRQALAQGRLQLVYQPMVDAQSQQLVATEALLRWDHPQRGCIGPQVLLPLSEKQGLGAEIGCWVIEEATRQAGLWRAGGLPLRVAVNLSAAQLRQDDFVDHLCRCLQRHGVPPADFVCEVSEALVLGDEGIELACFDRLAAAGIAVSIDDVGTGCASLASLRRLRAAELKIDRRFVAELERSRDARSIITAIVAMAQRLALRVVAEGVESERQRRWLLGQGCDGLQGHLIARPMPPHVLAAWARGEAAQQQAAPGG